MNNPTDTNQASEDELIYGVDLGIPGGDSTALSIKKGSTLFTFTGDEAVAIIDLIRTEKLKLLAEVRERVVGEDERIDIQSEFDKIDVPHLETDKYPGLDGVRQASRNIYRNHQRVALTKLEAEL